MTLGCGGGSEALSGSEALGDGLLVDVTDGGFVGLTGVVLEAAILI